MAGRSEVLRSAAYEALSVGGQRVFHVIERAGRDGAAISLPEFMERGGMCRSTARLGIKQCVALEFVVIGMGPRRVNTFARADGWRALDAREAKRRVAQARLPMPRQSVPPKPVPQVKVPVEQPRTVRGMPSLATMP